MKLIHLLITISLFTFASCHKSTEAEATLLIKGITNTSAGGTRLDDDVDDWNLNDTFTAREKQLFDTLNFAKRAVATSIPHTEGTISIGQPYIIFYANPIQYGRGAILYYHDKHIINITIVDSFYHKLFSYRLTDEQQVRFDFITLKSGIYRMYYVIQDMNYNIVHLGHGDILKE